jgi:hypothetical protein
MSGVPWIELWIPWALPMTKVTAMELGDEDGNAEGDRYADQHGDRGGHQRTVDRCRRAEFLGDRIPRIGGEEVPAESVEGRQRAVDEREDDPAEDDKDEDGEEPGGGAKGRVGELAELAGADLPGGDRAPCVRSGARRPGDTRRPLRYAARMTGQSRSACRLLL